MKMLKATVVRNSGKYPLCELCLERDADKKGSHLIPHFLSKRIENVDGSKDRDKELGFVIQGIGTTTYFGRSVQPDKLEEVFGELTEQDIEENKSHNIRDHLFCSRCEDNLAKLESAYAARFPHHEEKDYINFETSEVPLLFWISIVWRQSFLNPRSGLNLKEKELKRLRRILYRYLNPDVDAISFNASDTDLQNLGWKVLRSPDYNSHHPTFIFFHPRHQRPYLFVLDELVIAFYFKQTHQRDMTQMFFGLENIIQTAPLNNQFSGETITYVGTATMRTAFEELTAFSAADRIENYKRFLDEVHIKFGGTGRKMPDSIKNEIINAVANEERVLGRKYTQMHFFETIVKVLKKYQKKG